MAARRRTAPGAARGVECVCCARCVLSGFWLRAPRSAGGGLGGVRAAGLSGAVAQLLLLGRRCVGRGCCRGHDDCRTRAPLLCSGTNATVQVPFRACGCCRAQRREQGLLCVRAVLCRACCAAQRVCRSRQHRRHTLADLLTCSTARHQTAPRGQAKHSVCAVRSSSDKSAATHRRSQPSPNLLAAASSAAPGLMAMVAVAPTPCVRRARLLQTATAATVAATSTATPTATATAMPTIAPTLRALPPPPLLAAPLPGEGTATPAAGEVETCEELPGPAAAGGGPSSGGPAARGGGSACGGVCVGSGPCERRAVHADAVSPQETRACRMCFRVLSPRWRRSARRPSPPPAPPRPARTAAPSARA